MNEGTLFNAIGHVANLLPGLMDYARPEAVNLWTILYVCALFVAAFKLAARILPALIFLAAVVIVWWH